MLHQLLYRLKTPAVPVPGMEAMLSSQSLLFKALFIAAISVSLLFTWLLGRKSKLNVPILGADQGVSKKDRINRYINQPRELMWEGYTKYGNQVWGIDTHDGVKAVIPPQFINDLKSHPALSFKASIDNDMLTDYTYFGAPPEFVINAVRSSLTPSLPNYIPIFHQMIKKHQKGLLGTYDDWTSVQVSGPVLRLASILSARAFHSSEASMNPDWLDVATGYVHAVLDSIKALKRWPPYLRPFVHRFLPERAAIAQQRSKARKIVAASLQRKQSNGGAPLDDPPTMLDHLSSGKNHNIATDIEKQVLYQMTLVAVGTVTTFSTVTQCLYDLAGHPEIIPDLREEAISVLKQSKGLLNKESLSALKKMDSFMKECQRFSSPDLTTFQRAATEDMNLPDGTFIPKGTKLETATCSIHADEQHYENPDQFDAFRFYRKRQVPGQENKNMFVSVGSNDLAFGFGKHACPGRFLSHVVIKCFLVEFLLHYDIKSAPGVGRPKNIEFEAFVDPDPTAEVLLQTIHVGEPEFLD
ncbi:hypothetical protein AOCH_000455 [Aspergillus ochraceoroseus]|uniref:Cytochrome P450 monooxygenase n=2 Tax=Aspergillus ochraceoroseus TaxID=138278 RepID=A0A0F8V2M5_9EURO|nr:hypothetical protein AOCH_000455 [Aspergillus ochraceoroseus]